MVTRFFLTRSQMSLAEEEPTTNGFDYDSETASLTEEDKKEFEEALKNNVKDVIARRNQCFEKPETVNILTCPNGTTVYLIGTAHFSQESIDDVSKVMSQVQPDFVVVELCRNRAHVLVMDEEKIKQDMKSISFYSFIKSNGAANGVLQYLLLRLNAYLVDTLGMAPGGEFRAAAHEAAKQTHCHIIFGDRPVGITLQRAFGALGPWMKLKLFFSLLFEFKPVSKEQIEEMKKSDFLEKIIKEMAGDHPELTRILLDERDMYLAKSIWSVTGMSTFKPSTKLPMTNCQANSTLVTSEDGLVENIRFPFGDRGSAPDSRTSVEPIAHASIPPSDPNCELMPSCCPYWPSPSIVPRVVVAVVGIGHAAGIKKYWNTADTIDQAKLLTVMDPPLSWKAFKWTLRGLLLSSVVGLSYGVIKGSYQLGSALYKLLH